MLDELRDRIISFTSQYRVCVISASGSSGGWAVPAWHYPLGIEMVCWLPRWSDALYYLEKDPRVLLIFLDAQSAELRWLQYHGTASFISPADWEQMPPEVLDRRPDERYVAIHITPLRIDLIDENRGWGARETFEV